MPTFVLPGGVDDPATPSGGNVFDRRVHRELARRGRPVREAAIPGAWPEPDAAARARLEQVLDAVPDGGTVLLDGLVACGVPDVIVPRSPRLRLAVLVHLPLADETGLSAERAAALDGAERDTLRAASAVIATSPRAVRGLVERHGLDARRIFTVEPGTDGAPLAPGTDGGRRLLCVASVTPRKGHDILVPALAEVGDLRWECLCVGPAAPESAYARRVRGQVARSGLEARIHFAGPLGGAALGDAYAGSDVLVLPSRAETFGMVVTEALARGTPVIASAVGALPDTLGQPAGGAVPGLLVPPNDVRALAGALRSWLVDGDLRARLRSAARRRRDRLRPWADTARDMAAVLDRIPGPTDLRARCEDAR
ncbi:glycosyltransferase involved in cell wall biosynthesis [Nocardiopsis mwathae]|uniref:Glycosyltransferase involved in cell wall biosynthesis n=1 Tax=Nocardiopsis mwathae TaxID=1472723 RepID=A0A7W9YL71_9ACTN|nr:glycosyltransferase involved in cell wall biosynthesis [Nocardiopsis mwathae]